jgi:hypothetical protein
MNFNSFAILSLFALVPAFSGCGGDSTSSSTTAAEPAPVSAAGTWKGTVNSRVAGPLTARLILKQYSSNLTALSGTYATSDGGSVPIAGTIHGTTANFSITKTGPGCSGSYNGTGAVTIFSNGVKKMDYSSSVASNSECVGNDIVTGYLLFSSSTKAK